MHETQTRITNLQAISPHPHNVPYSLALFLAAPKKKGEKEGRRSARGRFFRESLRRHKMALRRPTKRFSSTSASELDGSARKNPPYLRALVVKSRMGRDLSPSPLPERKKEKAAGTAMGRCVGLVAVPGGDSLLVRVIYQEPAREACFSSLFPSRTFPLTPFPGEGGTVMGGCTGRANVPDGDILSIIVSLEARHAKPGLAPSLPWERGPGREVW